MNNPCKQCIVAGMCNRGCDKLERYIHNILSPGDQETYFMAADDIRQGIISIEYIESGDSIVRMSEHD